MNLEYENIIVAVDGSEASEKAFKKSVEIAKRNNAKLILTHVIDSRTFATAEAYDRTLAVRADDYATELLDLYIDRKSTRLNSSHVAISYAVFCLKKKRPPAHHSIQRTGSL